MKTARTKAPLSLCDSALARVQQGYSVFMCQPRAKEPFKGSKGFKDATKDPELVKKWWTKNPTANIGLVPGSAGHVVLDIDGPEGLDEARELGLLSYKTRTVTTARGLHLYFLCPDGAQYGNRKLSKHIDQRHLNGYVIGSGSVHSSGHVYTLIDENAPVLPLPDHIAAILNGPKHDLAIDLTSAPDEEIESAAMPDATDGAEEGDRNNAIASYLGGLRRTGADEAKLVKEGLKYNRTKCIPPLSEVEVRAVAASIAKYPAMPEVIERLNRRFAVVLIGSKIRILREHAGKITFLSVADFGVMFRNRKIKVGGRAIRQSDYWLDHPMRREFSNFVFEPGGLRTEGAYNLWRGWGVQPKRGDCGLFLAHLLDVVCSGDTELYRWVLGWFAHILRFPSAKLGTALVFQGRQGTGKSIVGEIFGVLVGSAYVKVSMARHLTGNFNALLGERLFVQAEECFWAGDKAAEGVLKDLITSATIVIERKGIDPVEAVNHVRLFITSNAPWIVPAGVEERRFAVIRVSDTHIQDHNYFGAIMKQMEQGGFAALFQHCLDLNLADVDLRRVPQTAALTEQKIASLGPLDAWWLDVLQRGSLRGDRNGTGVVAKADLFEDHVEHARKVGTRWKSIETTVGMYVARIEGVTSGIFTVEGHGPVRAYQFPPLQQCREQFSRSIPHLSWDAPSEWQRDRAYLL